MLGGGYEVARKQKPSVAGARSNRNRPEQLIQEQGQRLAISDSLRWSQAGPWFGRPRAGFLYLAIVRLNEVLGYCLKIILVIKAWMLSNGAQLTPRALQVQKQASA